MLVTLSLKQIALFADVELEFETGFHVLTGETGSGKSLILEALYTLLGRKKVNIDLIRNGEERASIEATFDIDAVPELESFLSAHGIEYSKSEYLIIKRELNRKGKHRNFINLQPVTATLMTQVGELLFSSTKQHAFLQLKEGSKQLEWIDLYGDLQQEVEVFSKHFQARKEIEEALAKWESTEENHERERVEWEWNEWSSFDFEEGRDNTLFEEFNQLQRKMEQGEKLVEIENTTKEMLSLSSEVRKKLSQISKQISQSNLQMIFEGAWVHLQEGLDEIEKLIQECTYDSNAYEALETRVSRLHTLLKRFQIDEKDLSSYLKDLKAKWAKYQGSEEAKRVLRDRYEKETNHLNDLANTLSKKRKISADRLAKELERELRDINMPHAHLSIHITPIEQMSAKGKDRVHITLSVNPGEGATALHSRASGGELSRVMLALASVLGKKRPLPLMVLDEIDSNIGGETATCVGNKIRELGKQCQILAVTHFPQVARFARRHWVIKKVIDEGRTYTLPSLIEGEDIKEELRRMVGGEELTLGMLTSTP